MDVDCKAAVPLHHEYSRRDESPSPPFRGEREGPKPQGWEGEVGGATESSAAPLTLPLSPRPAQGLS
jgi:hypothetical protein